LQRAPKEENLSRVSTFPMSVDLDDVRAAVSKAAERVSALIRSAPDPRAAVPGSSWNISEIAAHLALIGEHYARNASGSAEPFVDVSDAPGGSIARTNEGRLESEPERDVTALAGRVREGASSLVLATEGRSSDDPVLWNGQPLTAGALLGIALGEYLVHGFDLSRALSRDWVIDPTDARLVLASVLPLLPLLVNPETTATVAASFDLRVRGGIRVAVRIDHGTMTVHHPGEGADCHVSAAPVDLLLVAYGRRSPWVPALTGSIVAWGRKPRLGLRLTQYLVTP
jgi:uncharacterized protein (TIGR03083 family)